MVFPAQGATASLVSPVAGLTVESGVGQVGERPVNRNSCYLAGSLVLMEFTDNPLRRPYGPSRDFRGVKLKRLFKIR